MLLCRRISVSYRSPENLKISFRVGKPLQDKVYLCGRTPNIPWPGWRLWAFFPQSFTDWVAFIWCLWFQGERCISYCFYFCFCFVFSKKKKKKKKNSRIMFARIAIIRHTISSHHHWSSCSSIDAIWWMIQTIWKRKIWITTAPSRCGRPWSTTIPAWRDARLPSKWSWWLTSGANDVYKCQKWCKLRLNGVIFRGLELCLW